MIDKLVGLYPSSVVSIVGSGPSSLRYNGEGDISICLNGAIKLSSLFDYWMGFDTNLPLQSYFHFKPEIKRVLGVGIATMDYCMYPKIEERKIYKGGQILPGEIILPDPTPPHSYFWYCRRTVPCPKWNFTTLTTSGSISIPAVELAVLMGAKEIRLYGIDMNKQVHFDDDSRKDKPYRGTDFFNRLLEKCQNDGVKIKVSRSIDSKVLIGEDI